MKKKLALGKNVLYANLIRLELIKSFFENNFKISMIARSKYFCIFAFFEFLKYVERDFFF